MRDVKDFVTFISLLYQLGNQLVEEPIRGRLELIHHIFVQHFPEVIISSWEDFVEYINEFNGLCDNALKIDSKMGHMVLVNVNWDSIRLVENAIQGKYLSPTKIKNPIETNQATDPFVVLDKLLQLPFTPGSDSWGRNYDLSYQRLDSLLKASTSYSVLMKEKIKLKTDVKPSPEVCEDANHCNILFNALFSKSGNNVKSANINQKQAHSILLQHKHFLSSEAYRCCQTKIHFLPIFNANTDLYLGDCSYLDTCHKLKSCRYLHYFTLEPGSSYQSLLPNSVPKVSYVDHDFTVGDCFSEYTKKVTPPQWINCDIRELPFTVLGKFAAIIADPAWDIHMSLPYGTWKDLELMTLPMHELQDEGIILLWVTGRSLEIGRKALTSWGYKISDEVIWIKLNQLKRTIVTGRTGHWLNHSKEHLLVGLKGNPVWINRKVDVDVIVSGTRETSRKPDEVYDIVDRIVGRHARKLEIFGRDHNVRPGWFTIGNQVTGTTIHEPDVQQRYNEYLEAQTS